ncbi:MAG: hypothetical protein U1E47_05050 [Rivihabitans pingtungensis]
MILTAFPKTTYEISIHEIYQWLPVKVKPERDQNKDRAIRENCGCTGDNGLKFVKPYKARQRFIATVETAKHRIFQFPADAKIAPDNMLVVIAHDQPSTPGVLSSRVHALWALAAGGTLEDRPRHNKTRCLKPSFLAPSAADAEVIGALAENRRPLQK